MFSFFKKQSIDRKIPVEYKHLLDQRDYEATLGIVLQYFKDKGEQVLGVKDGCIATNGVDEIGMKHKYGLDNLVRMVADAPKEDWESVIYTHFNKVNFDNDYMQYYRKDYEAAKPFLKILIKPDIILKQQPYNDIIYKAIFPGTCCVVVFDYAEKFTYLSDGDINEWGKTTDELFEAALHNISKEKISIKKLNIKDSDAEIFTFFSGDFSAPFVIELEQNGPFAIGKYGAVTAIPTKGSAFVAPINDKDVIKLVDKMTGYTLKFFDEDPGPVTPSLYWYYNGKFEIFPEAPSKEKKGFVTISVPRNLSQLVNEA